jgi:hypothetical protein
MMDISDATTFNVVQVPDSLRVTWQRIAAIHTIDAEPLVMQDLDALRKLYLQVYVGMLTVSHPTNARLSCVDLPEKQ